MRCERKGDEEADGGLVALHTGRTGESPPLALDSFLTAPKARLLLPEANSSSLRLAHAKFGT